MTSTLPTVCRSQLLIGVSLTALVLSVFTTSCATNRKQPADAAPDLSRAEKSEKKSQTSSVEARILEEYKRWQGTRHQLGGTGGEGIDCSGFVKAVYQDAFNIKLPRTATAQVRQGKPVALADLRPGDLVFFTPPNYPRHVGIFLNRSQFVHASKTKGVTISKLDEHYWRRYFWTARRILPPHQNP